MQQELIWGYLLLCLLLATLPWITSRLFVFITLAHKVFIVRLLEWSVYAFIALMAGWGLEYQLTGSIQAQDWEFYVSTLFMFIIMSFPGLIYLMKQGKPVSQG
ncbi:MAG: DUF2818 family protein [Gammaproteobacteria bacterium]|nr:DUF2818 family protein [Gammaproteobacteria bacterium]